MSKKNKIIISHGKRPIWNLVFAALLYTISFYALLSYFFTFKILYLEYLFYSNWIGKLNLLSFTLPIALRYSMRTFIHLNIEEKKIKKEYTLGLLKWGFWKKLPSIKYVSIFKQSINKSEQYVFDINLWLEDNEHINVYRTSELFFEEAFSVGYDISKHLGARLLDSTADYSTDWYWVEMSSSCEILIKEHVLSH